MESMKEREEVGGCEGEDGLEGVSRLGAGSVPERSQQAK